MAAAPTGSDPGLQPKNPKHGAEQLNLEAPRTLWTSAAVGRNDWSSPQPVQASPTNGRPLQQQHVRLECHCTARAMPRLACHRAATAAAAQRAHTVARLRTQAATHTYTWQQHGPPWRACAHTPKPLALGPPQCTAQHTLNPACHRAATAAAPQRAHTAAHLRK